MTLTIEGITISPGLAQGKLHLHRSLLESIDAPDNIARDEVDEELSRLDIATEKIADNLLALTTRVEEEIVSRLAEVFGAHQMILGDSSLLRHWFRRSKKPSAPLPVTLALPP